MERKYVLATLAKLYQLAQDFLENIFSGHHLQRKSHGSENKKSHTLSECIKLINEEIANFLNQAKLWLNVSQQRVARFSR